MYTGDEGAFRFGRNFDLIRFLDMRAEPISWVPWHVSMLPRVLGLVRNKMKISLVVANCGGPCFFRVSNSAGKTYLK